MRSDTGCQVLASTDSTEAKAGRSQFARAQGRATNSTPALEPECETEGQRRRLPQHVHPFREGDPAVQVYQLVEGAVMLYKLLPDGRRSIVEVLIAAGDVFGISSLPIHDCSAETLVAGEVIAYDRTAVERSRSCRAASWRGFTPSSAPCMTMPFCSAARPRSSA